MSPRTLLTDEQIVDQDFLNESEFNEFLGTVTITGATATSTAVLQNFNQYFPGRGLITAGAGIAVATGINFVQISNTGLVSAIIGGGDITVSSGSNFVRITDNNRALVSAGGITVTSGTNQIFLSSAIPNALVAGSNITIVSGTQTTTIVGAQPPALIAGQNVVISSGTNTITVAANPASAPAIVAGSNIQVVSGSNTVTIVGSQPPAITAGGDVQVISGSNFIRITDNNRAILGSSFINVSSGTNSITIDADAIIAGAGITVTSGTSTVTIASTAAASVPNAIVGIANNITVISGSSTTTISGVVTVTSGIGYINDSIRGGKALSVTRPVFSFGWNGLADGNYLNASTSNNASTGYPMVRPATITAISAWFPSGPANKQFEVRKNGVATSIKTLLISAGSMVTNDAEDIDLNKGDYLQVFVSSALTGASDPVVNIEVAWRLP